METWTTVRAEFETAVAVARQALEEFNREPLVPSKRGGSRVSSWWAVYRQASEIAQRWHRKLRTMTPPQATCSDAELDRLLNGD
jgi:hypothetical protein